MDKLVSRFDPLELAKIIGEPLDPRKPYTDVIESVCFTDTAEPTEYVYYHVATNVTNQVYTITSTGQVTSSAVTPETPAQFTFVDNALSSFRANIAGARKARHACAQRRR